MSTTLSDTIDTYELLGRGSYTTYLDRVKAILGWTSTSLVP